MCLLRPLDFFADSGATQHMSDQRHIMSNFIAVSPGTQVVKGIGNTSLTVLGIGDVRVISCVEGQSIQGRFMAYISFTFNFLLIDIHLLVQGVLKGVLFVPQLGANLFSIGAATRGGAEVFFSGETVSLTKSGRTEIQGQRVGDTLYYLNIKALDVPLVNAIHQASAATSDGKDGQLSTWHHRLAHLNTKTILDMSRQGAAFGIGHLHDDLSSSLCDGCVMGKMHRSPFKTGRNRATEVGQLIHSDVCGPMQVPTPGGSRYFVVFKDDFSRWCVVRLLKQKSQVADCFQEFVAMLKRETGKDVKTLRSDNGGEYFGSSFADWLAKSGIRHESSTPYTPQQNGVAERVIRTLMEAARCQMYAKNVDIELWGEAVASATYVLNRASSTTCSTTPYELWHGKKPDISHLRIFGCRAFVHTPDETRRKLDAKAQLHIFVGYSDTSKGYRCWNPTSRRVITSRDVLFDESKPFRETRPEVINYGTIFPLSDPNLVRT